MNKKLLFSIIAGLCSTVYVQGQFTFNNVQFYVGSGTDTALLIVDFKDGTSDSSYAWGYLFNGTKTGEDALKEVAAVDINFSVSITTGFLNDIIYNSHSGIGGSPNYWSTWSGTDSASLSTNSGIGAVLNNGDWFACSYTDFSPAIKPGEPFPAFNPLSFGIKDVKTWIGSGSDSAILVIDFLKINSSSSFAWGFLFNDSTTGADMLSDIATSDSNLTVNATAFLNDIIYLSDSGMGGQPNFWGTWSATNLGNWALNMGISTTVKNGDFFGCSYTNFSPALRPNTPIAIDNSISIAEFEKVNYNLYPNPTSNYIFIDGIGLGESTITIYSANGKAVLSTKVSLLSNKVYLGHLPKGTYLLQVKDQVKSIILQ